MPELTPKQLAEVNEALVTLFTSREPELEGVVRFSLGHKELYTDFAGRGLPLRDIVDQLVQGTERLGITTSLLVGVIRVRSEPGVKEVIGKIVPDVLAAAQQADTSARENSTDWVRDALRGIAAVQSKIDDDDVRAHLVRSSGELNRIANDLETLAQYKALHDSLHKLQIKRLGLVFEAASKFLTDSTQRDTLREYTQTLHSEARTARNAAAALPETAGEKAEEMKWITELEQVIAGFRDGMKNNNGPSAMKAYFQLKKILRQQPGRLDDWMVRSAKQLKLARLITTLEAIAEAIGQNEDARTSLASAIAGLKRLLPDLMNRVEQHTAWQEIDRDLGRAEEGILQESSEPLVELEYLWPDLKRHVSAICVTDATSEWATSLLSGSEKFEKALPLPASPPIPLPAKEIFKEFISTASTQFYLVDQALNDQCGEIVKIGVPLQKLLDDAAQPKGSSP